MAKYNGTVILTGMISPTDTLDKYPTHEDILGKGGYHTVDAYQEMTEIFPLRQKIGMMCYVRSEKEIYVLTGNDSWEKLSSTVQQSISSGPAWSYQAFTGNIDNLFIEATNTAKGLMNCSSTSSGTSTGTIDGTTTDGTSGDGTTTDGTSGDGTTDNNNGLEV